MKKVLLKVSRLMTGFFLYGLGIVLTIKADLGLAPWGVFHQGIAKQFNITMGSAVIFVGAAILIIDFLLGERIGWGTISNIYFIGTFIDLIEAANIIPVYDNLILRFLMMVLGMATISLATFLYLSTQLGSGPRDGLMVALTKRTSFQVGLVRSSIELTALIIGYFLGGKVGWGTLIMSLGFGFFIQTTFRIFRFDVKKVIHRYVDQDFSYLINKFKQSAEK